MAAQQELARYLLGPRQQATTVGANRGQTLDPTGYVNREIDNRMNRAATSDNRSGLAQNILARQDQGGANPVQYSSPPSGLLPSTMFKRTSWDELAPVTNPPAAPQAATMPTFNAGALPSDQGFLNDQMGLQNQWQNLAQGLLKQRQDAETGFTTQFRDLEETGKKQPWNILSQFAGRGMGQSTGYTNTMGDYAREYLKNMQGINENRTKADQSYQSGIGGMNDQYYRGLSGAVSNLGGRLAQQAGDLGLTGGSLADYIVNAGASPTSELDRLIAKIAADVAARAGQARGQ